MGISLYTSVPDVHIGDTLSYSVLVFNIPFPACDATQILAGIVTPDGRTNMITLRRTTLVPGDSDYYTNVVSYIVRAQDINADGSVRATAFDNGNIHQNDTDSRGGGFQGVNTQVNQPCVQITAQCVGSVGENGAITFTGLVTNCGNNTLVGLTISNFVNNGFSTLFFPTNLALGQVVLFPTNLARGQVASFSGRWVPLNACLPSTATLVVRATDEFTATPRTLTNSVSITCQNVLTPGIKVTKSCPAQPVSPGQLLTFSGSVSNTGNVTLTNIVVVNDRPAPNTPVFTLASLAPGAVANFTGSYTAPTNCSLSDTLTARAASICGVVVTSSASATCSILTTPRIAVTAVCPATPVVPGGSVTYSGTVRNTGDITLTNVIVVSDRPAANTTVFTAATLAPGAIANFTGTYTVPANSVCSVPATVTASGKDVCTGNGVTNTVVATCLVTTAPSIAVTLVCPAAAVAPGGSITYTGTVRNTGNVTLNNVLVVSSQPNTVLTLPSLAPGASANFTVIITAPADACSVSSTVTASGSDACSAVKVSNTASATCPLLTTSRIAVTQTCPANPVSPGGVLTFSGTVSNAGNITLTNVVVLNNLSGATPVFTVARLAPGALANFTGSYTVPANSGCSITSTVTAGAGDTCTGARVTANASATCLLLTAPRIVVTQTCPANPVSPGDVLTYSGTVRNAGDITLTNVVVLNDRSGRAAVFTVASLAPGATANFTGSYVTHTDCCVDSSTLSASGKDICTGAIVTDTATKTCTLLTLPKIVVTKVCPTITLEPGDLLKYSGTVSNAGNITLVDVTVVNNQSGTGASVLGPITLAPGESVKYTASYVVPPDFCGTDTVTARGLDDCTKVAVSNSVTTTCSVVTTPRIAVTQNCPSSPTPRGGVHTFTGTVSNPGNVTLTNVFVVNNQPAPNTAVIGPITLAPGASVKFTGSYTAQAACCEILNTITARGQDRCSGTLVAATASVLCPLLSTPRLAITRVCPATPVAVGGVFVFKGSVSNSGDVYLTNVFVYGSHPASLLTWRPASGLALSSVSPQNNGSRVQATLTDWLSCQGPNIGRSSISQAGNNTPVLGPFELAPGESKEFSGSYVVKAGSNPLTDTVTARGMDTCQARTVSATANCSGPVGTQSVSPVVGPINLVNGLVTVSWSALPGVTYFLQYKGNAHDPIWINIPGNVTAGGVTASKQDPTKSSKHRFYRVMVVEQ